MSRIIFVFALLASVLAAADPVNPVRKRVGLTLSGGSALGLAHVGVIQWLEEHHVPVSYITGTSMGGLVGGVYATGHDSIEMKEFVRSINWAAVFGSGAPYENLIYRRKEDRRRFQNSLDFGLKGGFRLPAGLSSGSEVGLVISRIAAPYANYGSYDNLPTPFRCVAVDLIEGSQVVFSSGTLYTALRSTMSLPAMFSPLPVDHSLLVDGGTLNNLPVDIAKQMGADYTIAVVLDSPRVTSKGLDNILTVAGRSLNIMITDNELLNRKSANLVLAPDLTGLSAGDFNKFAEFEERGYAAAEKQKVALLALAVSDEEWRSYLEARRSKRRPDSITAGFVDVRGVTGDIKDKMQAFLESYVTDEPLDRKVLETSLTRLTGIGPYQSADYDFVKRNGVDGLGVNIVSKAWGPPFLAFGLSVEGSDTANVRLGFGGRLTFINIGSYASEWRTDFNVGLANSISSEFYRRIRGTNWFFAPRISLSQTRADIYTDNTRAAEFKMRERGVGADFGYAISRFSEIRAGYIFNHTAGSASTGLVPSNLNLDAANFQTVRVAYAYDHQDSALIARRGLRATTEARWNLHSRGDYAQYGTIDQRFSHSKFFNDRYGLLTNIYGGATLGPRSYFPQFSLGGPYQMTAYGRGQQRGDFYYMTGFYGMRAISADRSKTLGKFYVNLGYEAGQAFTRTESANPAHDGVAGVIGETPIGVVFAGFSIGTEGNRKFFFRIGRSF